MESTRTWIAQGKDGQVEFDGHSVRIWRPHHVRQFLAGMLRGCFRSARVGVALDKIEGIRLGRTA